MRAKMVTRQMTTTTATVMTVSKSTGATLDVTEVLSGKFDNNDAILKTLVKRYKDRDVQPVFIKEVTVEKIVVIGKDNTIPAKATLTTADNKKVELAGTKVANPIF